MILKMTHKKVPYAVLVGLTIDSIRVIGCNLVDNGGLVINTKDGREFLMTHSQTLGGEGFTVKTNWDAVSRLIADKTVRTVKTTVSIDEETEYFERICIVFDGGEGVLYLDWSGFGDIQALTSMVELFEKKPDAVIDRYENNYFTWTTPVTHS